MITTQQLGHTPTKGTSYNQGQPTLYSVLCCQVSAAHQLPTPYKQGLQKFFQLPLYNQASIQFWVQG